jgi:hypothetical protein
VHYDEENESGHGAAPAGTAAAPVLPHAAGPASLGLHLFGAAATTTAGVSSAAQRDGASGTESSTSMFTLSVTVGNVRAATGAGGAIRAPSAPTAFGAVGRYAPGVGAFTGEPTDSPAAGGQPAAGRPSIALRPATPGRRMCGECRMPIREDVIANSCISCSRCGVSFHLSCMGLSRDYAQVEDVRSYACPTCWM